MYKPAGLGQVTRRTSAAVIEWQVVALDPCAPYAAAVRAALLHARIAVDHFHLVKPASDAVTTVRRRVALEVHGRCGRKSDPAWANRRRLQSARGKRSQRSFAAMWNDVTDAGPTGQLLADWIAKELLRELLACARQLPAAPRSPPACSASILVRPASTSPRSPYSPSRSSAGRPSCWSSSRRRSPMPGPRHQPADQASKARRAGPS